MTITEALAEIKTVLKRIESKREYVATYLVRIESLKDPLEKDGGSQKVLKEEMQAIVDLENRIVDLRAAINAANNATVLDIEGYSKTMEEWLVWRRDVAPQRERFIRNLRLKLENGRNQLRTNPLYETKENKDKPLDMIVNVDEGALNKEAEQIKNILGQLDGQLSLKNATVMVEV